MSQQSKAEIYKQIAEKARARMSPLGPEARKFADGASMLRSDAPAPAPELVSAPAPAPAHAHADVHAEPAIPAAPLAPSTPSSTGGAPSAAPEGSGLAPVPTALAEHVAELEAAVAAKDEELELAKRKAMAYVEELLLDKQDLTRKIAEEEDARINGTEDVRGAAEAELQSLADAVQAEEEAQATAQDEAREALAQAQQLRSLVESLKSDGQSGAPSTLDKLRSQLAQARESSARHTARLDAVRAELAASEEALADMKAAAEAAAADASAARREAAAAREAAAKSAAALAACESQLAGTEAALTQLAPNEMAAARDVGDGGGGATTAPPAAPPPLQGPGEGDKPSHDLVDVALTPHPSASATAEVEAPEDDQRPLAEVLTEWAIDGAKEDSAITNPVLGIEAILEYVNDWRTALAEPEPKQKHIGDAPPPRAS